MIDVQFCMNILHQDVKLIIGSYGIVRCLVRRCEESECYEDSWSRTWPSCGERSFQCTQPFYDGLGRPVNSKDNI